MKVKFLKSIPGSPDGNRVVSYIKGEVYDTDTGDISEGLIKVFKGLKDVLEDHIPFERKDPEVIQKAESQAPQNKVVEPVIVKEEVIETPEPKKSNKKIRNRK